MLRTGEVSQFLKACPGLAGWVLCILTILYFNYPRAQPRIKGAKELSDAPFHISSSAKDAAARQQLQLSKLCIYPIKSCRGISLEVAELSSTGLLYDREFMLTELRVDDQNTRTYKMLTIRNKPRMSLIDTAIIGEALVVSVQKRFCQRKMTTYSVKLPLKRDETRPVQQIKFMLHKNEVIGDDLGPEVSVLFTEFLGCDVRLIRKLDRGRFTENFVTAQQLGNDAQPLAFPDQYPLLILSRASIDSVNERLVDAGEEPLSMYRFRPNLIISGCKAFEEDKMRRIEVDGINIDIVAQCARCLLPNVDTETGVRSKSNQPYKTLDIHRRVDEKQPLKPVLGVHAVLRSSRGQIKLCSTLRAY